MKILLAIDDSKCSEAAVQDLIALARPHEVEVRVLHVIEPVPIYLDGQGWNSMAPVLQEEQQKRGDALLAQAGQELRNAGFSVTTDLQFGDPKVVVIDSATSWHADLILLGSHGRKGLDRFLMGSVSEAVARHAPCSVQIARIRKP
jgi:nucleotide-binding universal stress UspA family protein